MVARHSRLTQSAAKIICNADFRFAENDPMATLILDPHFEKQLRAERAGRRIDRYDEVWDGTYLITPPKDVEHSELQAHFLWAFNGALVTTEAIVYLGVNVSDCVDDWTQNYRCPDMAVVMPGSAAIERDAYYFGGPDFLVEIVSPHDRSREKLDFYGQVGVRELLVVDRYPWSVELYRFDDDKLHLVGQSKLEEPNAVQSNVLPLVFRLIPGDSRPQIEARQNDGSQVWLI